MSVTTLAAHTCLTQLPISGSCSVLGLLGQMHGPAFAATNASHAAAGGKIPDLCLLPVTSLSVLERGGAEDLLTRGFVAGAFVSSTTLFVRRPRSLADRSEIA